MELEIVCDENELSLYAAGIVTRQLHEKPESLIVFPTGNTPLGMFKQLVSLYSIGAVDFSKSFLVELDEYFGIAQDDRRNLFAWLERAFISKVNYKTENLFRFNADAQNIEEETKRIENAISHLGGIDLIILGLGPNGHIGFNEPGAPMESLTRVVDLSDESIQSNSRYWGKPAAVPKKGFTMGMRTILGAKKVLLLVQGSSKAEILKLTLESDVTEQIPSTMLRSHPNLTVLTDLEATSQLVLN